ncbi:MAG TPA: O-antigen ligase family protein [Bryobacteraceae bacterium]|nr:O-antigen ligase family protein [Bryobacteraceae bacterium]
MLKAILYIGLTVLASILTFFNPLIGAIGCIEAYLFNPSVIAMNDGGFRYQLCMNLAFLLSLVVHRPRRLERLGREGAVLISLWVFLAIGAIGAAFAAVDSELAFTTLNEVFKTVLFSTALLWVVRRERDMAWIITACVIGVFHASFLHVFGTRWGYAPAWMGRDMGVLSDPQNGVLLAFVPTLLLLAMLGTWKERLLSWFVIPFALDSIVVTYQRAAFVALAAQAGLLVLLLPRRITLRLLPLGMAALALFLFRLTPKNYWEWVGTVESPEQEASAASRPIIYKAGLRMFLDHPLGVGYRNFPGMSPLYVPPQLLEPTTHTRAAHDSFLTILCETGIFGFASWTFAFFGAAWLLRRIRKKADPRNLTPVEIYAMGLELGLYGWMVVGIFHNMQEVDPPYWFVALAVVLTRLHDLQRHEEESPDRDDQVFETAAVKPA